MISHWWHQALTRKVTTFRRDRSAVQRHRFRPVLELLEDRRLMATITVTNSLDDTDTSNGVSLREAIESINKGADFNSDVVAVGAYGTDDTILFDLGSGNTIAVSAELPAIVRQILIDGTNLNAAGGNIELTGDGKVTGNGLTLTSGASDSILRGLVINGFKGNGILLDFGVSRVLIEGNFIGTDAAGSDAAANTGDGILIRGSANTIGGTGGVGLGAGMGNLISGNAGDGIEISSTSTNNLVLGNFIGTDITGTQGVGTLGNGGNGVFLDDSSSNTIGGESAYSKDNRLTGEGNLISNNLGHGILINNPGFRSGSSDFNNLVQGNFIGTDVTGTQDRGNDGSGVKIFNSPANLIGGNSKVVNDGSGFLGNLISGNVKDGVLIEGGGATGNQVQGNFIGTDITGTKDRGNLSHGVQINNGASNNTIGGFTGQGNTIAFSGLNGVLIGLSETDSAASNSILGNSIFSNGLLGIDLGNDGPTPNDTGDGDDGPNFFQNFPTLLDAFVSGDDLFIVYSIADFPTGVGAFRIEFFASNLPDPSGFGEGQLFLGSVDLPGTSIPQEFKVTNGASLSFRFFTATATFLENNDETELPRSTSEFSNVVFIPTIPVPPDVPSPDPPPPGGDPIVVRIVQGELPPEARPIFVVTFLEFTVSALPPPPTASQVKVLAPLVRDVFENLVDAPGEIHGQILDDPNALGQVGPDTYPLHGQPVFLDFNRNGEYDDGEPITVTNAKGEYTFTSLTPGQYTVHLVLGRTQDVTFAPKQDNKIELRSGNMIVTNVNFGVRFRARRRPGGGSALPGNTDGVLLAAGGEAPSLPIEVEYGVDSLPLGQGQPAPPLPVEEPAAAEGDAPASGLFRWCGWLLGAALLIPWQQLANRHPPARREQRTQ